MYAYVAYVARDYPTFASRIEFLRTCLVVNESFRIQIHEPSCMSTRRAQ